MAAVFATEDLRLSNLVKHELWPEQGFCRKVITVNESTAKNYVQGTVLGKVTSSGKYKISVQNASDGSQVPAAIVLYKQAIPGTTDTKVLVMNKGPAVVSMAALVLDASYDLQAEKDFAYEALEALWINVANAV